MTKSELKNIIKEVINEMSVNENYEDGIKDTKDRFAYLALRKQELKQLRAGKYLVQHFLQML